jgi:rRNA maturation RNase YbeY
MNFDITFHLADLSEHPFAENEDKYINWLSNVAKSEHKTISSLTYIFCSDEYLLDINIKYLGHDYYTDIITFPYKEGNDIESDMYISIDRVKENAIEFSETFENELCRVMVHGLLHLIGYGDKNDDEIKIMRQKEEEYLAFFLY